MDSSRHALVGYTGFVGGNLRLQNDFGALYNSKNIAEIAGRDFDLLVFAGAQAKKWWANANPDEDWAGIESALGPLRSTTAKRVVLISTVDVLPPEGAGGDEDFDPRGLDNHAYGRHRLALEDALRAQFDRLCIVRLPGLFGCGLKKNVIFDLLTDNQVEKINPESSFQYYDLAGLWAEIEQAEAAGLELVHFFTEPVATRDILERFFPEAAKDGRVGSDAAPTAHYDFRTKHAGLYGGPDGYMASREAMLERMARFIEGWRNGKLQ